MRNKGENKKASLGPLKEWVSVNQDKGRWTVIAGYPCGGAPIVETFASLSNAKGFARRLTKLLKQAESWMREEYSDLQPVSGTVIRILEQTVTEVKNVIRGCP